MYCRKCGTLNPEDASFCQNCGTRLGEAAGQATYTYTYTHTETYTDPCGWGGLSADEAAFIGQNQDYYSEKFAKLRRNNTMVSWNWCGCFFFPYWAIYRKMYKESIGYVVIVNLLTLLLGNNLPTLVLWVLGGMFSNWLYMRSVDNHMVTSAGMPEMEKRAYFARFGGVSGKNVLFLYLGVMALSMVVLLFSF